MRILIKNAFIITQNKKREYIPRGFIVIKDDKLEIIGRGDFEKDDSKKINKIIDAKNAIILPGFINAHIHLGESIYRKFFKGTYTLEHYLNITERLTKKTNLIEGQRKIIGGYTILSLIKNGTTTICGGRTTDLAEQWGVRNVSGYMVMNSFKLKKFTVGLEKKYKINFEKIKKTRLSYPALFIHSLNTFDFSLLNSVKKILKKYPETRLILHVAETKKQEEKIKNKTGMSSVRFLYQGGLLNKQTILIHGNWISEGDLIFIKKNRSSIVHCLSSSLRVADKILDFNKIIKNKIKICIATDGVVTGQTFSILDEANRCLAYHGHKKNIFISPQRMLDLITCDAAKILGLKNIVGSIEKNKKADLVFIRKSGIKKNIFYDVFRHKRNIFGVMIDGKLKIWKNKVIKNEDIERRFRFLERKIKKELVK